MTRRGAIKGGLNIALSINVGKRHHLFRPLFNRAQHAVADMDRQEYIYLPMSVLPREYMTLICFGPVLVVFKLLCSAV